MNDRVRRIMIQERIKAERLAKGGLPRGEKLGRWGLVAVAIIITCNQLIPSSVQTGPPPLAREERGAAQLLARTSHMSIKEAEAFVIANRPTKRDEQRWEARRQQREAEEEALQRAFPN
ncbi:hypothetical protein VH567_10945 [Sphingomonas sp. 4RDLI-65]|uniref:hypothetical protein n=1 Tax=Sphingomonas sp. 4RDLI-65 TaxID=3111641 RepID=UPI003C1B3D54